MGFNSGFKGLILYLLSSVPATYITVSQILFMTYGFRHLHCRHLECQLYCHASYWYVIQSKHNTLTYASKVDTEDSASTEVETGAVHIC